MIIYKLNNYTDWNSLPWKKIKERIILIQKKIYNASRQCNKQKIYFYQNLLINSNEAKIKSIELTCQVILNYYLKQSKETYFLSHKDKFSILYYLFSSFKKNELIKVIIEKTKEILISLCMQPEWEARFEPILQSNIQGIYRYSIEEKLINFFDKKYLNKINSFYLNYKIIFNFIDKNYLIKKLHSVNYVNKHINILLNNQIIIKSYKIKDFLYCHLYTILSKIIFNGTEWFYLDTMYFNTKKYNNLELYYSNNLWICLNEYKINRIILDNLITIFYSNKFIIKQKDINIFKLNLNKKQLFIQNNIYYLSKYKNKNISISINKYKNLLHNIKKLLYKKNILNKLRIKINIKIFQFLLKAKNILVRFYKNNILYLSKNFIYQLYLQINLIFSFWIKKKQSKYMSNLNLKEIFLKSFLSERKKSLYHIYILKINR